MTNDKNLEHLIDADPQDYQRDDPEFEEVLTDMFGEGGKEEVKEAFSEYGDNAGTIINTLIEKI